MCGCVRGIEIPLPGPSHLVDSGSDGFGWRNVAEMLQGSDITLTSRGSPQ